MGLPSPVSIKIRLWPRPIKYVFVPGLWLGVFFWVLGGSEMLTLECELYCVGAIDQLAVVY